jgi:hypothetical protein
MATADSSELSIDPKQVWKRREKKVMESRRSHQLPGFSL